VVADAARRAFAPIEEPELLARDMTAFFGSLQGPHSPGLLLRDRI
jgi:hypothetical protein